MPVLPILAHDQRHQRQDSAGKNAVKSPRNMDSTEKQTAPKKIILG